MTWFYISQQIYCVDPYNPGPCHAKESSGVDIRAQESRINPQTCFHCWKRIRRHYKLYVLAYRSWNLNEKLIIMQYEYTKRKIFNGSKKQFDHKCVPARSAPVFNARYREKNFAPRKFSTNRSIVVSPNRVPAASLKSQALSLGLSAFSDLLYCNQKTKPKWVYCFQDYGALSRRSRKCWVLDHLSRIDGIISSYQTKFDCY